VAGAQKEKNKTRQAADEFSDNFVSYPSANCSLCNILRCTLRSVACVHLAYFLILFQGFKGLIIEKGCDDKNQDSFPPACMQENDF
jgi:hypothetical protein